MIPKKSRVGLSDEEKKLWQKITEGIVKLDNNRAPTPMVKRSAFHLSRSDFFEYDSLKTPNFIKAPAASLTEQNFMLKDLDHSWNQKLRKGKVRPDGKIDLHGMTENRAYDALQRYIKEAYGRHKRLILVVTGKGRMISDYGDTSSFDYDRGTGILKKNVPRWLSQGEIAPYIVSYYTANRQDGGEGALYVVLKRNRG